MFSNVNLQRKGRAQYKEACRLIGLHLSAYVCMFPLQRQDFTDKSHYLKLNLAIIYGETSVPRGNWPQRTPTSLKYMI